MVANIQVLRGFAATLVVWHHIQPMLNSSFGTSFQTNIGAIGVDIFFVISGFIMFYRGYTTPDRIPFFLISRFFRIVPLYWLATFALVTLFLLGFSPNGVHHLTPRMVLESIFFIPSSLPNGNHALVLLLGWTLMYELFFYALFAVSFFARSRRMSLCCLTAALCSTSILGTLVEGWTYFQMYYLAPITIEFLYGAVLGMTFDKIRFISRRSALIAAGSCFVVTTGLLIWFYQSGEFDTGRFGLRFLVFGIPSFFFVLGFLILEKSGIRKRSGMLVKWGDTSYSLYLFHPLILQGSIKFLEHVLPQNGFGLFLAIALSFLVLIFATWVIYEVVETRIITFGKRVAKGTL